MRIATIKCTKCGSNNYMICGSVSGKIDITCMKCNTVTPIAIQTQNETTPVIGKKTLALYEALGKRFVTKTEAREALDKDLGIYKLRMECFPE